MSNFLDNLVARTLDLAPVVQPRVMSRFEPVSSAGAAVAEEHVEVEALRAAEPPVMTKIIESHVAGPLPVVSAPQVERKQPRADFQQVINTIRNTYVESHEVVQVPVVEKVLERVIEGTRIHTEKTDLRTQIRENRIIEPARGIEPNPSNPRLNIVEPAPVTTKAPVVTPQQPIVPPVVTRIEPAPTMQPQRFELQPAFQPEPTTETINVTIGRVDVRAVFSAQAPKTPVRAASTSSLDDYLKQRSEGRR